MMGDIEKYSPFPGAFLSARSMWSAVSHTRILVSVLRSDNVVRRKGSTQTIDHRIEYGGSQLEERGQGRFAAPVIMERRKGAGRMRHHHSDCYLCSVDHSTPPPQYSEIEYHPASNALTRREYSGSGESYNALEYTSQAAARQDFRRLPPSHLYAALEPAPPLRRHHSTSRLEPCRKYPAMKSAPSSLHQPLRERDSNYLNLWPRSEPLEGRDSSTFPTLRTHFPYPENDLTPPNPPTVTRRSRRQNSTHFPYNEIEAPSSSSGKIPKSPRKQILNSFPLRPGTPLPVPGEDFKMPSRARSQTHPVLQRAPIPPRRSSSLYFKPHIIRHPVKISRRKNRPGVALNEAGMKLGRQERFAFQYIVEMREVIGNGFEDPAWKLLLQVAHEEPVVRSLILSISGLHQAYPNTRNVLAISSPAVRSQLGKLNFENGEIRGWQVAFMVTYLLTILSKLQGDEVAARKWVRNGYRVLKTASRIFGDDGDGYALPEGMRDIALAFGRLNTA